MLCPVIGPFISKVVGYLYSLADPGQILCIRLIYAAIQELWAVVPVICRMAFHLASKVITMHLDSNTDKAYLCNKGGMVFPFLSRLVHHTLNSSIHTYPSQCPSHSSIAGNSSSRIASSSLHRSSSISTFVFEFLHSPITIKVSFITS